MTRTTLIAGALIGLVLALAAGAVLGRRVAPKPLATQVVHVGPASLVVPRGWARVSSTKSAAILAVDSKERAMVRLEPVRTPAPSARATMLAGYRAWRERTVSVLPTSAGVVTVECATCAGAIQSISVPGAAILDPASDFALALRAPAVVSALDRARVRGRQELRRARTPADQSRAAHRLAAAHDDAEAALRSVAGPDLLERLAAVRAAYAKLSSAATEGSAADFDAARARVGTAETELNRSLGDVASPVVQPRASAPAPIVSHGLSRSLLVLVVVLFGGLGVGLALTRSGRRRTEPAPAARAARRARPPPVRKEPVVRRPATERPPPRAQAAKRPAPGGRVAGRVATTAPAASGRVAERPTSRPTPQRREPVLSPDVLNATWTCELTWSTTARERAFCAQATAAGEDPVEIARSPKINWPPFLPPSPDEELVAAARRVARALVAAGWTPTTRGPFWYAQRFAWARDGSPPTLGTISR